MRVRAESQQVHHHHFAVIAPAVLKKAAFGSPPVRQNRRVFPKPIPIYAVKNLVCQFADLSMVKMLTTGQHATEQNSRIHGGNFGVPQSFAGVDIRKVIEKAAVIRQFLPKKAHGIKSARFRRGTKYVTAFFSYTERRKTKAGGGNASQFAGYWIAGVAAVQHDPGFRMSLAPEKFETGHLQFVQEGFIGG